MIVLNEKMLEGQHAESVTQQTLIGLLDISRRLKSSSETVNVWILPRLVYPLNLFIYLLFL